MIDSEPICWTSLPLPVGHHRGLSWVIPWFFVSFVAAISSTLTNSSPSKTRAAHPPLIHDEFETPFLDITSPTCWASPGVVVRPSLLLGGLCWCYYLNPDSFSHSKTRAAPPPIIHDKSRTLRLTRWKAFGVLEQYLVSLRQGKTKRRNRMKGAWWQLKGPA